MSQKLNAVTRALAIATAVAALSLATPAMASAFFFSTGNPDGKIAVASRPGSGAFEIEAADDFTVSNPTVLTLFSSAAFTGLIPAGSSVQDVVVEIYRVFPQDSDVNRTSGPPIFSTSQVPTRVNSPSDVAFDSRDSAGGGLSFSSTTVQSVFTAGNSIQPGGIHPKPGQTTGGDGPVTGSEVHFDVTFTTPIALPADHYFFVPQVQ
jgi:hypothetical protein